MSQSIDLLSRFQAATEGSAELDRAFLEALGWTFKWRWHRPNGLPLQHDERAPRPTRSLDDITRMIEQAGMRWHRMESGGFIVSADDFGSICSLMMTGPLSLTHGMISVLNFRAWRARATP